MELFGIGCGGGGSSGTTPTTQTAQLVDNNISGVSYTTATKSGTTDTNGYFSYIDGETITFKIGDVLLGIIDSSNIHSDGIIYPTDLVGNIDRNETNNTQVVKILQFLQSLDTDNNASNGIDINTTIRISLQNTTLDFTNSDLALNDINTTLQGLGKTLKSRDEAISHFRQTLIDAGILKTSTTVSTNNTPVATFNSFSTTEDIAYTGILTATDSDGDTLTYTKVTDPTNGALSIDTNGSFTYTPTTDYFGDDSFTYKVNDGTIDSNTKTVSITVISQNDAPVSSAQTQTTNEDTTLAFTATDFTDGFSDADGDTLQSVRISELPTNGTLKLSGSNIAVNDDISSSDFGNITYTPNANYNGSDSFKGYGYDGSTFSNVGTMNITVASVNDVPTASAGNDQTIDEGDSITLNASSSSDIDGSISSYVWKEGATTLSSNMSFSKSDFSVGTHTIILTVTDNEGASSNDTITITVNQAIFQSGDTWKGYVYNTVTSPYTGKEWLDRNLGAYQVCTAFNDTDCYGDYYQWGRNADGHQEAVTDIVNTPNKTARGTASTRATSYTNVGHGDFITNSSDPWDWLENNTQDANNVDDNGSLRYTQWSKIDGTSICPVGFRVPTLDELKNETIDQGISNRNDAFTNFLKLPSAGLINIAGNFVSKSEEGFVYANSVNSSSLVASIYFTDSVADAGSNGIRAGAIPVRCIKD